MINAKPEDSQNFPTVNFGCNFLSLESGFATLAECQSDFRIK